MKILVLFAVLFLGNVSWSQSVITFERIFVKVDTIAQNSVKVHKIKFTNTGNKPLVVKSCETESAADKCTFDKKPVAPGQTAYLDYQPDASTCGKYARNITVTTKEGETVTLHVKGVIRCAQPPAAKNTNE